MSSSPPDHPSASEIESTLRLIVRTATKHDQEVTVNSARTEAETRLGLDIGFFKNDAEWKSRSKSVISAAAEEPASPEVVKVKPAPTKKRKSDESDESKKVAKRQKKATGGDSDIHESDGSPARSVVKKSKPRAKPAAKKAFKDSDGSVHSDSSARAYAEDHTLQDSPKPNEPERPAAAVDDESDFSSVLDEPPPAKKKRQTESKTRSASPSETTTKSKSGKPKDTASTESGGKDLTPQEEELKRLQSWLVKCGLRKVWSKELAPFPTPQAKIKHLKGMLEGAGMTGRFSEEKAKSIKEARELKAEIEAAKDFNSKWGEGENDGDEGSEEVEVEVKRGKPVGGGVVEKRKPKGLIDFGDSGDDSG